MLDRSSYMKNNSFKPICCDLFSGAGGFSLGAKNAGFAIAAAIEFDINAATTYKNNIVCSNNDETKVFNQDINSINIDEFISISKINKSECDLMIGGPPCQGFSSHRRYQEGVNDPRNQLLIKYFEFVKAIRPKFFVVENVPGLLWNRNKEYLYKFYQIAKNSGYNVLEPKILNAMNYGIPQNRRRVFILGIRDDIEVSMDFWPPKPTHGADLLKYVPSSVVFTDAPENDPNDIHSIHGDELVEAFKRTPLNGGSRLDSGRILDCHKNHNGHKDVYGRINSFLPAPTMTASCTNPSKGRFVHPTEHHGITVRQAARIQTFPDDFIFYGGLTSATRQIGNAVPVRMAEVVLKPIYDILISTNKSESVSQAA